MPDTKFVFRFDMVFFRVEYFLIETSPFPPYMIELMPELDDKSM